MSATNVTPNIELPVFVGTDKPAWLTDWNGAMNKIDAAVGTAETDINGLETAVATQGQSITSLTNTVGQHTTSIQALTNATTHNAGDINTINSLIGNGTPTTTDHTIIGAINELHADQGDLANLTTTDKSSFVAAINEVASGGGAPSAQNVSYDNTSSGMTANNVQAAIDELASGGETINFTRSADLTVTAGTDISYFGRAKLLATNGNKLGKIYGGFRFILTGSLSADQELVCATLSNTGLPTLQADYDIFMGVAITFTSAGAYESNVEQYLRFKTDGTVQIILKASPSAIASGTHYFVVNLPPCIYSLHDMGD